MQRLELVLVFGFIESELCSNETQEHLCSNHFCMMKLILAVQDLLLNGQTLKLTSVPAQRPFCSRNQAFQRESFLPTQSLLSYLSLKSSETNCRGLLFRSYLVHVLQPVLILQSSQCYFSKCQVHQVRNSYPDSNLSQAEQHEAHSAQQFHLSSQQLELDLGYHVSMNFTLLIHPARQIS